MKKISKISCIALTTGLILSGSFASPPKAEAYGKITASFKNNVKNRNSVSSSVSFSISGLKKGPKKTVTVAYTANGKKTSKKVKVAWNSKTKKYSGSTSFNITHPGIFKVSSSKVAAKTLKVSQYSSSVAGFPKTLNRTNDVDLTTSAIINMAYGRKASLQGFANGKWVNITTYTTKNSKTSKHTITLTKENIKKYSRFRIAVAGSNFIKASNSNELVVKTNIPKPDICGKLEGRVIDCGKHLSMSNIIGYWTQNSNCGVLYRCVWLSPDSSVKANSAYSQDHFLMYEDKDESRKWDNTKIYPAVTPNWLKELNAYRAISKRSNLKPMPNVSTTLNGFTSAGEGGFSANWASRSQNAAIYDGGWKSGATQNKKLHSCQNPKALGKDHATAEENRKNEGLPSRFYFDCDNVNYNISYWLDKNVPLSNQRQWYCAENIASLNSAGLTAKSFINAWQLDAAHRGVMLNSSATYAMYGTKLIGDGSVVAVLHTCHITESDGLTVSSNQNVN